MTNLEKLASTMIKQMIIASMGTAMFLTAVMLGVKELRRERRRKRK